MKKIFTLALSLVMTLSLFSGCSNGAADGTTAPDDAASTTAAKVQTITEGVLTIATSPDFSPMEFVDATKSGQDKYVGFDISMAKYFAQELGLELVITPMSFEACQTAVSMGAVDMALSGFSWKPDREESYNLSDYYWAGDNEDEQILITLADNAGKYTTADSLAGLKVGAQTASLQESLCQEQLPECELVIVTDLTTALMQLRNGDFDALAVAKGNGQAIIAKNADIAESGFYFEVDPKYTGNVVLMQKGNDALTEAVNELLAQAEAAGYYTIWYDEAKSTAGIEVIYDDEGNEVTGPASTDGE